MKISQNNGFMMAAVPLAGRLIVPLAGGLIVLFLAVLLTDQSALAQQRGRSDQQGAPVNLLDFGKRSDDSQPADNQTTARPLSGDAGKIVPAPVPAAAPLSSPATPASDMPAGQRSDLPATSLQKRAVSKVSLASVGLKKAATLAPVLNSLIWSESEAEQALALISSTPAVGSSVSLQQLAAEIISIAAVPPRNAGALAEELVAARLDWLARAGQSDSLSQIVRLLPDDDRWAEWKRWQLEYDLIRRADESACQDAEKNAQRSLDNFWHQAGIICALLAGDRNKARFSADILKASGAEDDNFFQLVDRLLGQSPSAGLSVDLTSLDPVDLILMDAAHEQISLAAFEQMPSSMIEAAAGFRYLAPDAALKTSVMMLERGLQKQGGTEQVWRSLLSAPMPAEAALATLDGLESAGLSARRHDQLASALLWVSLATRSEADTDMLIKTAIRTEVRSGRAGLLLPLYASLVRQRLAATDGAGLSDEIRADFALVLGLDSADQPLPQGLETETRRADDLRHLFDAAHGAGWQPEQLDNLDAWPLLPVLTALGSAAADRDWTAGIDPDARQGTDIPPAYHRLAPRIVLAIEQTAASGNVAETGLLAAMAVQPYDLGWIAPVDSARIVAALKQVGLDNFAEMLADEVIISFLLRRHFTAMAG